MNKILIVFGTRPELIKLAPVIREFTDRGERERLYILNTGQHLDLVQDLAYFRITADHRFELNRDGDSLSLLNGLLLLRLHELKGQLQEAAITITAVIGQGDTCTTFAAAQFAFYEKLPFVHIEAGLRTDDFQEPFPEEYFRKTIASMASFHFPPTAAAEARLLAEGITPDRILVTGNTGIDNLRTAIEISTSGQEKPGDRLVLITIHRRENIRHHLQSIIRQVLHHCKRHPEKAFVWIDNPGYKLAAEIASACGQTGTELPNLRLIPPVSFMEMIALYRCTELILTDSGGIQEEAGYLGIPTILFRSKTERTEGIDSGISKYADEQDEDLDVIMEKLNGNKPATFNTIYGDGRASGKIVRFLAEKGL
jgi:UDP-N-acetylglucosamine 2-epimerase (non-hydrolysing)